LGNRRTGWQSATDEANSRAAPVDHCHRLIADDREEATGMISRPQGIDALFSEVTGHRSPVDVFSDRVIVASDDDGALQTRRNVGAGLSPPKDFRPDLGAVRMVEVATWLPQA
jgi:hypothetical protein